ncbi:hypothetical protein [Bradyrhizobium erythrophlei]|jgi:hypothetical protein|nr:hypothetical protein [Bradyrhizobium erythrophlei]
MAGFFCKPVARGEAQDDRLSLICADGGTILPGSRAYTPRPSA